MVFLDDRNMVKAESQEEIPIQDFFGFISDANFLISVSNLLQGVSLRLEIYSCSFPNSEDEDGNFLGVKFSTMYWWSDTFDEVIVPIDDFYEILKVACRGYLQRQPKDEARLKKLFAKNGVDFNT